MREKSNLLILARVLAKVIRLKLRIEKTDCKLALMDEMVLEKIWFIN